ncbi:ubiquinol-cytochrome C chaperone [Siculibacillus lacustris]|uniref:Ubiquinol-cytochrome C chaperone n=1 Tax=Siculibacillus lacustris TaxID=1549641 RepID=A0A4Q9VWQ9_9HYPH|nr:ubiquinol-cytochrome C chaperone family protein [Siculibacillus lacustris]TBW39714.1 ubiquinol-cytochrome C chaperone [Siculibacillus lacustris]
MIFGLFGHRFSDATLALYRAIVTEARHPEFYLHYGVPDTVTARFDMIVLHIAVVLHRLRAEAEAPVEAGARRDRPDPAARGQELVDLFFQEMDRALREMGVGDTSIPKKMKKLAAAWNGRTQVYDKALEAADADELAAAIARNVLAEASDPAVGAAALARHVLAASAALADRPVADVLDGRIVWPDPALSSPRITT